MPSSVAEIIFAGVGDATRGAFIDGHLSRQDNAALSQLARRMGGQYHNGNVKHIPSEMLRRLIAPDERRDKFQVNLRVIAIVVLASSAALLCLLPLLLEYFGSAWKPVARAATLAQRDEVAV
jgi:Ca-activated chloride channel family protein